MTIKTLDKLLNLKLIYLNTTSKNGNRMYCRNDVWIIYVHASGVVDVCGAVSKDGQFGSMVSPAEGLSMIDISRVLAL